MQTGAVSAVTHMRHLSKDLSKLPPHACWDMWCPPLQLQGDLCTLPHNHRHPSCKLRIALIADDLLSSLLKMVLERTINLHIISVLEMEAYAEKASRIIFHHMAHFSPFQ